MNFTLVYTKTGILVADGASEGLALLERYAVDLQSGKAAAVVIDTVNGTQPVVSGYLSAEDLAETFRAAIALNLSDANKQALATLTGALAASLAAASGWGSWSVVGVDAAVSAMTMEALNLADQWISSQNWSGLSALYGESIGALLADDNVYGNPDVYAIKSTLLALCPNLSAIDPLYYGMAEAAAATGIAESGKALLKPLADLFGVQVPAFSSDYATYLTQVYATLDAIEATPAFMSAAGSLVFMPLQGVSPEALVANSQSSVAFRYALKNLSPFVLLGSDSIYLQSDPNGSLALENWGEPQLLDRATMLAALLAANSANVNPMSGSGGTVYADEATGQAVRVGGADLRVTFADSSKDPVSGVSVTGILSSDRIFGTGTNSDVFHGMAGDDQLYGGAGNDILTGGEGSDQLYGGAGADWLGFLAQGLDQADQAEIGVAGAAGNLYDGGTGNDVINGSAGYDTYIFRKGDGRDFVITNGGADILKIQSSADLPIATSDVSFARQGYDLLVWIGEPGAELSDSVRIQSWFSAANSPNQLGLVGLYAADGTAIRSWLPSEITTLALTVHGSDDTLAPDNLVGLGGFSNSLYGHAGDDTLAGTSVTGYTGSGDKYVGGLGNDILVGTSVSDRYVYAAGDGYDSVYESAGAGDVLQLMGIASSQMTVSRQGYDLRIAFTAGDGGAVDIKNWYLGSSYKIESFEFTDKTMTASQVEALNAYLVGTENADTLTALSGLASQMFGLGGNDTLTGGTLADVIDGGDGDDTIYGAYGGDTLIGGAGNDTLRAGRSDGYDDAGNTLIGGAGNDYLHGNTKGDTYVFNLGDGQDTVYESGSIYATGTDTLQFGESIAAADIQVLRSNSDLVLKHVNGVDQVTLYGWYLYTDSRHKIEQVTFADGTAWDTAYLSGAGLDWVGTEGADTVTGQPNWANVMNGLGGNDALTGGDLADVIDGGDGDDTIYGGYGADTLMGSAGNDTLYAWRTDGYDNAGNTFFGGSGNDRLYGHLYADIYVFNPGDGQDTVYESGNIYATGTDTLQFGESIAAADIQVLRSGSNLVLKHANGVDQVTLYSWYLYTDSRHKIEQVAFADGTVWDTAYLSAAGLDWVGTEGADTVTGQPNWANVMNGLGGNDALTGGELADVVDGGEGDDTLYGGYGADTLKGGAGNDTLYAWRTDGYDNAGNTLIGGTGNDRLYGYTYGDTYVFNLDDGQDTLSESGLSYATGTDTLQFGEGIAAADIQALRSGSNLILKHANGVDQVTIGSWYNYTDARYKLEQVTFADGSTPVSGISEIEALVTEFWGTAWAETLTASGNIHTLIGNKGNDTLNGGLLQDYFRFNLGDGQDTVNTGDTAGHDILVFEDSFAATTLTASRSADNLLLTAGSGDKVTVTNWFGGNQASVLLPGDNLVSAATITNFLTTEGNPNSLRIL